MSKKIKSVVNVVASLIGLVIAFCITYLDSIYFLKGVEVERGYEAVGGEAFFLVIIFFCVWYACKHILCYIVSEIMSETTEGFDI